MQDVVFFAEVLNGAEEALGVLDEGDEDAERDGGTGYVHRMQKVLVKRQARGKRSAGEEGADAAAPDDQSDGGGAEQFDRRIVEGVGEDGVLEGVHVQAVDRGELVEGAALAVEELHDGHAAHVLLHIAVDAGDGGADTAVALAHMVAEDAGDVKDDRDDGQRQQGERPAHLQHDDDDEGEDEDVFEDREDARGEHLVERVDVGGDAGDEFADGWWSKKAGACAGDGGRSGCADRT